MTDPTGARFIYERLLNQQRFNAEQDMRRALLQMQVGDVGVWSIDSDGNGVHDSSASYTAPTGAHAASDTAYFKEKEQRAWECDYCGGVRAANTTRCEGCGASRRSTQVSEERFVQNWISHLQRIGAE